MSNEKKYIRSKSRLMTGYVISEVFEKQLKSGFIVKDIDKIDETGDIFFEILIDNLSNGADIPWNNINNKTLFVDRTVYDYGTCYDEDSFNELLEGTMTLHSIYGDILPNISKLPMAYDIEKIINPNAIGAITRNTKTRDREGIIALFSMSEDDMTEQQQQDKKDITNHLLVLLIISVLQQHEYSEDSDVRIILDEMKKSVYDKQKDCYIDLIHDTEKKKFIVTRVHPKKYVEDASYKTVINLESNAVHLNEMICGVYTSILIGGDTMGKGTMYFNSDQLIAIEELVDGQELYEYELLNYIDGYMKSIFGASASTCETRYNNVDGEHHVYIKYDPVVNYMHGYEITAGLFTIGRDDDKKPIFGLNSVNGYGMGDLLDKEDWESLIRIEKKYGGEYQHEEDY